MIKRGREQQQPKLKPTETMCWVNKQLVVLFDPARKRLVYVLGTDSANEDAAKQLREVVKAGKVTAAYFEEPSAGHFQPLSQMVSQEFSMFTFTHHSEGQQHQEQGSLGHQSREAATTSSSSSSSSSNNKTFPDWLFSRMKKSKLSWMKACRLYMKNGGARPLPGGNSQWEHFLYSYINARRQGIRIADDISIIQNRDADNTDGLARLDDAFFNCDIRLGPDPTDFTVRIRTRHESPGVHQHLERCLREESDYLNNMAKLEEQWQGPSVLDKDWGTAQRMSSTTGRAKARSSSASDSEGEDETDASPAGGHTSDGDASSQAQASGSGLETIKEEGDEGQEEGPVLLARPIRKGQAGDEESSSTGSSSSSTRTSSSSSSRLNSSGWAMPRPAAPPSVAESSNSSESGPDNESAGGIISSGRRGRASGRGSRAEQQQQAGSSQQGTQDPGDEDSDSADASAHGQPAAGGSGGLVRSPSSGSAELAKDLELAELLLGRKVTLSEVAQLRAAFAQSQEVEATLAAAGALPGKVMKLQQAIESFISMTGSIAGTRSGRPSGTSSGRPKRLRLQLPAAVQKLAVSELFSRFSPEEGIDGICSSSSGSHEEAASSSSSSSAEQAAEGVMRWLRVPSSHRYVLGKDIVLVVGQEVLPEVAASWDRLERKLMMAPEVGPPAHS